MTTTVPGSLGLTSEQVEHLLELAGRAPSLHNTQPWRFILTPDAIELHADRARQLPVVDPDGRAVRLACGAALYDLRLGLLGLHVQPDVTILPDRSRPELLAVVRHGGAAVPTPEQTELLRAVPVRTSNRHPFSDAEVGLADQGALQRVALAEGAFLHLVTDRGQVEELQDIAARAHHRQLADPALRAEYERWTAVPTERHDGVQAATGVRPEPQVRWVLRDFTGGTGPERVAGKDFEENPLVAVLSSMSTGDAGEVQAGQALQRVLLTATVAGLAVSVLSHTIEVPEAREELRRLVRATRAPQMVLRIGHGWPVASSARRPMGDLVQG